LEGVVCNFLSLFTYLLMSVGGDDGEGDNVADCDDEEDFVISDNCMY